MKLARILTTFLIFSLIIGVMPNALLLNKKGVDINIYVFDVVIALIFIVSIFLKKYRIKSLDILIISVFLYLFILNTLNFRYLLGFSSYFYLARLSIYILSYPFFIYLNTKNILESIFKWVVFLSVPAYLLIFVMYPNINIPGFDPHIFRIYGMFLDPNYYAVFLNIAFFYLLSNRCKISVSTKSIFIIITLISLFLTFSRLGILLFLFGIIFSSVKQKNISYLGLLLGFFVVLSVNLRYIFRFTFFSGHFHSFFYKVVSFYEGVYLYNTLALPVGFNNIKVYRYYLMSNTNNVSTYFDFLPFTLIITGGILLILLFSFYLNFLSIRAGGFYVFAIVCVVLSSFVMNVLFNPMFFILIIIFSVLSFEKSFSLFFRNKQPPH